MFLGESKEPYRPGVKIRPYMVHGLGEAKYIL